MRPLPWTAGAGLVCLLSAPAAQAQTPAACGAVLSEQGVSEDRHGLDPCRTLAALVATMAPSARAAIDEILRDDEAAISRALGPRDLQARHPQQTALGGTGAQGQAVPSVQPAGVAAGSIGVVGSDAGDNAIAAFTLNPAILFLDDTVTRALAQYSRFADITVFVPVTNVSLRDDPEGDASDRSIRYFGLRVRINAVGPGAGDGLWEDARTLVRNWVTQRAADADHVRSVLADAPDLAGCVQVLLEGAPSATVRARCGREVDLDVDTQEAELLRAEFARIRRAADARYFGADIRLDVGDPTMGAVAGAAGSFLFAGLAYGRQLTSNGNGADYGFRARLGARHAKLDDVGPSELAVEGGLGFHLEREIAGGQQINASAGIEFRYGNAESALAERFQSNHLMARGSFVLPVTTGNSLSINVGIPLGGEVSPVLSVNFDWGLLLPEHRAR